MKQLKIALALLAVAVMMGAFGAHALKVRINAESLEVWKTGVLYHFIHAIGMVMLYILFKTNVLSQPKYKAASILLLLGIFLFSGSIYLLSTREIHQWSIQWVGPITPIGGLLFISGWIVALVGVKDTKQ